MKNIKRYPIYHVKIGKTFAEEYGCKNIDLLTTDNMLNTDNNVK